jgi:hypothetical protein
MRRKQAFFSPAGSPAAVGGAGGGERFLDRRGGGLDDLADDRAVVGLVTGRLSLP